MGDWSASHYENVELQLQAAADRAIEHAKVSAGERVLDVCCGTGNAAAAAAAIGAKVDGIDLADRPLALARQRVLAGHFQVADATRLPFENDAFDVAVSVFGVIFAPGELAVPKRELDALGEIIRSALSGLARWSAQHPETDHASMIAALRRIILGLGLTDSETL